MEPHDQNHRRTNTNPQSIPLQDLSQPQRSNTDGEQFRTPEHGGRLRALTDISRDLWGRSTSGGRGGWSPGGNYSPIMDADRDGSPTRRPGGAGVHLTIPSNGGGLGGVGSSPTSPLDGADFQTALAGVPGLSFRPPSFNAGASRPRHSSRGSLPTLITQQPDSDSINLEDREENFSAVPLDTMPLTQHLAPISGAGRSSTDGQRHDREGSRRSVHFGPPSPSARLGDDLSQAEAGGLSPSSIRRSSSIGRTLTPTSPLQRTGTMLRNMSQRIVNISNEQDVVERSIRRKSSVKAPRASTGQPSLPPVPSVDGEEDAPGGRIEKTPSVDEAEVLSRQASFSRRNPNPLMGKSLGIFPPDSKLRLKLCELLVHPWTEPTIFILIVIQAVLLTIDSSRPVKYDDPTSFRFGGSWIDYGLLALFSIYTVELMIRTIVSGFILNPLEYSTINRHIGLRKALQEKVRTLFGTPHTRPLDPTLPGNAAKSAPQQSVLRSFTTHGDVGFQGDSRQRQRVRLAHRAFLRHSFNRLDFIAVVAWWISFVLGLFRFESSKHVFVFRMLSCLRILRLLYLTSGTTVILRSLKKAASLLVNVAFLISFFWLLFAIIGLQSFKSSLRRSCVWTDPNNSSNTWDNQFKFCGGHLNATTFKPEPWLLPNLSPGAAIHKGYICPVNSQCIEGQNPYNGSVSFDNIFQSLELVFVVMSSNTFSDLMYYLTNSDYLSAAIFFAIGIVILFFWLVNLLIAVITSSFQVIREESKTSAFTGEDDDERLRADSDDVAAKRRRSTIKQIYEKTKVFWILVISFGIIVQCMRSADMGPRRRDFIDNTETAVTFLLLLEIVLRFLVDWRNFFRSKRNLVDLGIAVVTSIIQIPPIHNSGTPYAWLTIFQVIRIYRVVLAVPLTHELIMTVLGNFSGLLNLILFVFLFTFLAAILASQMFRGSLPNQDSNGKTINITFSSVYNSFLGMYQIFSSENWTTILYNVTNYDVQYNTAWMGAAFFILWFILANFIIMNMFIAVIQENFDVSEDEKRLQQVKAFLEHKESGGSSHGNLSLSTIFKYGLISGQRRDPLAFGSATTELLLKDAVVKDFLDQNDDPTAVPSPDAESEEQPTLRTAPTTAEVRAGTLSAFWASLFGRIRNQEPNPFYSRLEFSRAYEDLDPRQMAKEVMSAHQRRKKAQREYLRKHPNYNVSLFLFKPNSKIRRLCQRIVGPGRGGDRIDGVAPSVPVWYAFSAFIYAAIVAMVILACITTPLYQKEYFQTHYFSVRNWFVFSDMGFAVLFSIEALIKVVADGFFWTPNAYFRGSWGFIDGVVLITLWINIATALYNEGQVSRAVGAFKALRALRLLNVSDSARNNFHAVIVRGFVKVLSAAFVSLSLLIPFAIYGLNLFLGKMQSCNDGNSNIDDLNDCVGEYATSSPFNWNVYAPRVASNSYYSFDNFGGSLFILFQIVSQEGWIDVMWSAESIVGAFRQPQPSASQGNALYFVVFNLLGAVFVLTLFVSVFMRNYTEQTGVAYLTTDQRSWLELRKLLRQISPSKRPLPSERRQSWKEWCYRRAVRKTGRWQRFVTGVLIGHLILLCIEFYPSKVWWDRTRDYILLTFTLIYISNIVIRIIGLTWSRFRRSSWDIYSVITVSGTFVTSILILAQPNNWVFNRLHKLCLVSISLLLIPRNNQLDQLFKTAAASLPLILNLLATWFVLFLTFAIALTQTFGLTRFGANESDNVNFRNVPKALILLFRTSVGEGWNQIMEDLAGARPPFCVDGKSFNTDCGSPEWARALFILWNILSMYIFVNLFVSLIYESFSYVYQRSSGLSVISREEIRRFKQAWAEFDPDGTGYITKEAFPRLLGELSGVFEMRIYDGDFTVKRLIEDCSRPRRESGFSINNQDEPRDIDIKKLNERLKELPVFEIRRRRARMNKFYEEVLVSSDPDRGIAFTSLLMILAHYKVINDNKSLRLHEFLRRRARLQRVDEAVRRNVVVGFFDTVFWSRHLRRHRQSKYAGRMTAVPQFTVPEIFVDDGEEQATAGRSVAGDSASGTSTPHSGVMTPPSRTSMQISPAGSPTRPQPATRWQQGGSDRSESRQPSRPVSPLGVEPPEGEGGRSRAGSSVSAQGVLEALDNSAWGESIRKSFSTRRRSPSRKRQDQDEDD